MIFLEEGQLCLLRFAETLPSVRKAATGRQKPLPRRSLRDPYRTFEPQTKRLYVACMVEIDSVEYPMQARTYGSRSRFGPTGGRCDLVNNRGRAAGRDRAERLHGAVHKKDFGDESLEERLARGKELDRCGLALTCVSRERRKPRY